MTKRKETPTTVQRTIDGQLFIGVDFYPSERYAATVAAFSRAMGATVRTFRNEAQGYTVLLAPSCSYDTAFDAIRKAEDNIDYKVQNALEGVESKMFPSVLKGLLKGFKEQLASVGA